MEPLRLPVEEFTTPNPITASEDSTIEELRSLMTEYGIRHLPITTAERIVGIVSDRDLRVVAGLDMHEKMMIRAGDIMARDPVTFSSETPLDEVALEMSKLKIGSVIVTENDKLLGIFTLTDALNALIEISRKLTDRSQPMQDLEGFPL